MQIRSIGTLDIQNELELSETHLHVDYKRTLKIGWIYLFKGEREKL